MLPHWLENPDPTIYLNGTFVVLDFETTNLDKGNAVNTDNRLLLASWMRSDTMQPRSLWGSEYEMADLLADIEWADFLVAQNVKFELKWLHRCGLDLRKVLVYDIMIGEYVLAGNRKWPLDLGSIASRYGYGGKEPYVDRLMKGGICPSDIPASMLQDRCEKDIYQTYKIFDDQRNTLDKGGLLPVMFTRCIFTPCLADMELRGMHLDAARVSEEYSRLQSRLAELEAELGVITGGINMRSPKQKAEFLYDTLKFKPRKVRGKEVRGTDKDTIAALKATTKKQKQFKALQTEYAKVNALLTKSVEFMHGVCKEKGGTFYAQFNQCVTKTHRLSSSGLPTQFQMYDKPKSVQFQNFPRQYKGMFMPRAEGYKMGEIDGAQLEFRVAAYVGQDKQACQDIIDGVDVHQFTADTLTEAGQETTRQEAKSRTFKPLYGGSSGTDAEVAYFSAFKDKYRGIAEAQNAWLMEVVSKKSLTIESGLKCYWPDCTIQKSGYIVGREQICNLPVQSLATAEIIPIAVTYLWYKMDGMDSFLVNTIHDSAIAEIKEEEGELFHELGVQSFTHDVYRYLDVVYGLQFNVPLGTGYKLGEHWGEGDELVTTVTPDIQMEGVRYE